jgi:hypothetical protein
MLLAGHLLALGVACAVFVWVMALHRRARAAEQFASRKVLAPAFESAFATRPPLWMAVRAIPSRCNRRWG